MIDRTAKVLLFGIAIGVWLLVLSLWVRPPAVRDELVLQELQQVHDDLDALNERLSDLLDQLEEPDGSGSVTHSGARRVGPAQHHRTIRAIAARGPASRGRARDAMSRHRLTQP